MSTDLALNNASGPGLGRSLNDLNYQGNCIDYGQYRYGGWYYGDPPYWWPTRPIVYAPVIVTGHRVCTCPNCAGDCCPCADCKVKRLEKRVADLEKER